MSTIRHESKIVLATLILVGYALALSAWPQVMSTLQSNKTVSNTGSIKTAGVGVYSDSACTTKVTSINWGTIEAGSNASATVYIRNEGDAAATLSKTTSNWSPSTASTYITLNWNYAGATLNANDVVQVKFTLVVSSSISGITSFSFDITITATS
jgi:hypothetical protein